jgi:L-threonylcarbamoyladenylate synthase
MTLVLQVDPAAPDADAIARAADCLRRGGLVAFPTETVYGLGVHALDRGAVRRLFEAKGRPANDPLIVHVPTFDAVAALTRGLPPAASALADRFWPGPLTLVLPRAERVPDEVTAGLETVAVRIPSHPVARALLAAAGVPVAAPSANLFSRPSPTRASHVMDDLDGRIDMVLDAGSTEVGLESTVLDLAHGTPTVLRPGAVTLDLLRTVVPDARQRASSATENEGAMASPGMLAKHYSPRAPLTLYEGPPEAAVDRLEVAAREAGASGSRVGILAPREDVERIRLALAPWASRVEFADAGGEGDVTEMASRLYDSLRALDSSGVDLILARGVSAEHGLGAAIRDRLRRAAAGRIVSG